VVKSVKVAKVGIKKKAGFLYFIDKQGDVSMVKMNRGGRMRKKKKKAAKRKVAKKKRRPAKKKAVKRKAAKKRPMKKKK